MGEVWMDLQKYGVKKASGPTFVDDTGETRVCVSRLFDTIDSIEDFFGRAQKYGWSVHVYTIFEIDRGQHGTGYAVRHYTDMTKRDQGKSGEVTQSKYLEKLKASGNLVETEEVEERKSGEPFPQRIYLTGYKPYTSSLTNIMYYDFRSGKYLTGKPEKTLDT